MEMQARTAEKLLKNPCLTAYVPASETMVTIFPLTGSKASKNNAVRKMKKYRVIKANTSLIVLASSVFPSGTVPQDATQGCVLRDSAAHWQRRVEHRAGKGSTADRNDLPGAE